MAAATTSSSSGEVTKLQLLVDRLRQETAQLREQLQNERSAVRSLKALHESDIRKERSLAKRRENELHSQLNLVHRSKTETVKSDCDECIKLKANYDAELRRERSEHRKKENCLQSQLNELQRTKNVSVKTVTDCDQCAKFKATLESDLRKEKSEFKKREAALLAQLATVQHTKLDSSKDGGCDQCSRLSKDFNKQKELVKELQEKLEKVVEADKLKAADLRSQHEKHLTELSRITRTTKQETHILLEELKTKDRIIGQLRKNLHRTNEPLQMRKLREGDSRKIESSSPSSAACVPKPATSHHELVPAEEAVPGSHILNERLRQEVGHLQRHLRDSQDVIAHLTKEKDRKDQTTTKQKKDMLYRVSVNLHELEPVAEEDSDSAVSSAPSSLSPQPCSPVSCPAPPDMSSPPSSWPLDMDRLGPDEDDETAETDTELQLSIARQQVRELERALLVTRGVRTEGGERVRRLEAREAELLREVGDLREQNELLEFRILELEECHDKWSLRSHSTRDVCTDTESDSGVASLAGDHQQLQLSLNDDPVRQRLRHLSLTADDAEDRRCLLQVLALLEALEALSRDQGLCDDERLLRADIAQAKSQRPEFGREKQTNRIVATVLPFSLHQTETEEISEDLERASDKKKLWNTLCLQESGIFEGEPPEFCSQGTQTEPHTDQTKSLLDLTAEIQKLNRLRESVDRNRKLVASSADQRLVREVDFYKERLEVLERKVTVYESSGDTQARLLADQLNREVLLASQVKQLKATVQTLQSENSRLEEERCELEEAENDTRLHCQHIESEIETLKDRLRAAEESRMAAKRKARDSRGQAAYWENMVTKYEERNYELEERECELRHRLEMMECTTPAILLFNMWKMMQNNPNMDIVDQLKNMTTSTGTKCKCGKPQCSCGKAEPKPKAKPPVCECGNPKCKCANAEPKARSKSPERSSNRGGGGCRCSGKGGGGGGGGGGASIESLNSADLELMKCIAELREHEKQMKKRIQELEHRENAYLETLQQADEIWAQMEGGYKKRISQAEENEANMRDKLKRATDQDHLADRINELEESDRNLRARINTLEKENCRLKCSTGRLEDEVCACKDMGNELTAQRTKDEGVIRQLSQELCGKDRECAMLQDQLQCGGLNAQDEISLTTMAEKLDSAIQGVNKCALCSTTVSPDLVDTVRGIKSICEAMSPLAGQEDEGCDPTTCPEMAGDGPCTPDEDEDEECTPDNCEYLLAWSGNASTRSCSRAGTPKDSKWDVCPTVCSMPSGAVSCGAPCPTACPAPCGSSSRGSLKCKSGTPSSKGSRRTGSRSACSVEQLDLLANVKMQGVAPYEVVAAEVQMQPGKRPDCLNITTMMTDSGNLEVVTEGPPGTVEHTMLFSPSGNNVELVTEFKPEPNKVPSYFHEGREATGPDLKDRPLSATCAGNPSPSASAQKSGASVAFASNGDTATTASEVSGAAEVCATAQNCRAAIRLRPTESCRAAERYEAAESCGTMESAGTAQSCRAAGSQGAMADSGTVAICKAAGSYETKESSGTAESCKHAGSYGTMGSSGTAGSCNLAVSYGKTRSSGSARSCKPSGSYETIESSGTAESYKLVESSRTTSSCRAVRSSGTAESCRPIGSSGDAESCRVIGSPGTEESCAVIGSHGTEENCRVISSPGTEESCSDIRSSGTKESCRVVESSGAEETCRVVGSPGTEESYKAIGCSETAGSCKAVGSSRTAEIFKDVENSETLDICKDVESSGTAENCKNVESCGTTGTSETAGSCRAVRSAGAAGSCGTAGSRDTAAEASHAGDATATEASEAGDALTITEVSEAGDALTTTTEASEAGEATTIEADVAAVEIASEDATTVEADETEDTTKAGKTTTFDPSQLIVPAEDDSDFALSETESMVGHSLVDLLKEVSSSTSRIAMLSQKISKKVASLEKVGEEAPTDTVEDEVELITLLKNQNQPEDVTPSCGTPNTSRPDLCKCSQCLCATTPGAMTSTAVSAAGIPSDCFCVERATQATASQVPSSCPQPPTRMCAGTSEPMVSVATSAIGSPSCRDCAEKAMQTPSLAASKPMLCVCEGLVSSTATNAMAAAATSTAASLAPSAGCDCAVQASSQAPSTGASQPLLCTCQELLSSMSANAAASLCCTCGSITTQLPSVTSSAGAGVPQPMLCTCKEVLSTIAATEKHVHIQVPSEAPSCRCASVGARSYHGMEMLQQSEQQPRPATAPQSDQPCGPQVVFESDNAGAEGGEELKKVISKAQAEVICTLDTAHRDIQDALDRASRDVENALNALKSTDGRPRSAPSVCTCPSAVSQDDSLWRRAHSQCMCSSIRSRSVEHVVPKEFPGMPQVLCVCQASGGCGGAGGGFPQSGSCYNPHHQQAPPYGYPCPAFQQSQQQFGAQSQMPGPSAQFVCPDPCTGPNGYQQQSYIAPNSASYQPQPLICPATCPGSNAYQQPRPVHPQSTSSTPFMCMPTCPGSNAYQQPQMQYQQDSSRFACPPSCRGLNAYQEFPPAPYQQGAGSSPFMCPPTCMDPNGYQQSQTPYQQHLYQQQPYQQQPCVQQPYQQQPYQQPYQQSHQSLPCPTCETCARNFLQLPPPPPPAVCPDVCDSSTGPIITTSNVSTSVPPSEKPSCVGSPHQPPTSKVSVLATSPGSRSNYGYKVTITAAPMSGNAAPCSGTSSVQESVTTSVQESLTTSVPESATASVQETVTPSVLENATSSVQEIFLKASAGSCGSNAGRQLASSTGSKVCSTDSKVHSAGSKVCSTRSKVSFTGGKVNSTATGSKISSTASKVCSTASKTTSNASSATTVVNLGEQVSNGAISLSMDIEIDEDSTKSDYAESSGRGSQQKSPSGKSGGSQGFSVSVRSRASSRGSGSGTRKSSVFGSSKIPRLVGSQASSSRSINSQRRPKSRRGSRTSSTKGSYHGKNCTCQVCKCNPCKDPRMTSKMQNPVSECSVRKLSVIQQKSKRCPTCFCTECRCPNCIDPNKNKNVQDIYIDLEMYQGITDHISVNLNTGQISGTGGAEYPVPSDASEGNSVRSGTTASGGYPDTCDCAECKCASCSDGTKRAGTGATGAPQGTSYGKTPTGGTQLGSSTKRTARPCDCPPNECLCNPCSDPNRAKTPKVCTCGGVCTCQFCQDPNIASQGSKPGTGVQPETGLKSGTSTTVKSVTGSPAVSPAGEPVSQNQSIAFGGKPIDIIYPAQQTPDTIQMVVKPNMHPANCDCPVCQCQPCGTSSKPDTQSDCDCSVCHCQACSKRMVALCGGTAAEQVSTTVDVGGKPVAIVYPAVQRPETTQMILRPSIHPAGCDCPVCQCQPCGKSSRSDSHPEFSITQGKSKTVSVGGKSVGIIYPTELSPDTTQTIVNPNTHPTDCGCPLCQCQPCAHADGKPPVVPLETPVQGSCGPQMANIGGKSIQIIYPKDPGIYNSGKPAPPLSPIQSQALKVSGGHPDTCDCADCKCANCPDGSKAPTQGVSPTSPSATCGPAAICSPGTPGIQAPPNAITKSEVHPDDCDCPVCKCEYCPDKSTVKPLTETAPRSGPLLPGDCSCEMCACPSCADETAKAGGTRRAVASPSATPGVTTGATQDATPGATAKPVGHPADCGCSACKCDGCPFVPVVDYNKPFPHPESCCCDKCICKSCDKGKGTASADASGLYKSGKLPSPLTPIQSRALTKPGGHPVTCDCTECKCESCPDGSTAKPATETPGEAVTTAPKAMKKPEGHPDSCDCPECKCESCPDGSKPHPEFSTTQDSKTVNIGGKSIGISYPTEQRPETTQMIVNSNMHPADCDCPLCQCQPCANADGIPSVVPVETLVQNSCGPQIANIGGKPIKIIYPKDPGIYNTGSSVPALSPIQSQALEVSGGHPDTCDCAECKCASCPDGTKSAGTPTAAPAGAIPSLSVVPATSLERALHPITCTCPLCACKPCGADSGGKAGTSGGAAVASLKATPTDDDNIPKKLPANKIGPSFIKSGTSSKLEVEMPCAPCGRAARVQPVALTADGGEEWRTLDNDALKRRLYEMEKEQRARANEIMQIHKFMDNLQCSCDEDVGETGSNPFMAPVPTQSFHETMSGLQCALTFLQDKCRRKDRMIAAMTHELKLRSESGVFEILMDDVVGRTEAACKCDNVKVDYDRTAVSRALPTPEDFRPQVMRTPAEKPCAAPAKAAAPPAACCCEPFVDPAPLAVTELRRIGQDSLLVKWDKPNSKQVKGYEIEVNGCMKQRVHSAGRCGAVLHSLDMDCPKIVISVYAIPVTGARCQPPASAIYQPRPMDAAPDPIIAPKGCL